MSMRRMAACSVVASMLVGCRADDGGTGEHRTDAGDVAEERQAVALEAPAEHLAIARVDADTAGDVVAASGSTLRAWRGAATPPMWMAKPDGVPL